MPLWSGRASSAAVPLARGRSNLRRRKYNHLLGRQLPSNFPRRRQGAGAALGAPVKQQLAQRSSFGLHSPDGTHFGAETKDYNLREYLQQLKEISNAATADTDVAARQLSEIYGFEVREDTFIETDTDLIDLRAIPPPQTPDELDSLSLMNAAPPKGFEGKAEELDSFLQQIMVAPPTQKATPAKELTPEEIMSFIIPPPPNLEQQQVTVVQQPAETECLYSNSVQAKREFFQSVANGNSGAHSPHVIEYATVERKSKFSCCPTSKREEQPEEEEVQPPPRTPTSEQLSPPPARSRCSSRSTSQAAARPEEQLRPAQSRWHALWCGDQGLQPAGVPPAAERDQQCGNG